MVESFLLGAGLLILVMLAIMLANKLRVAYPILLVILGLVIGLVPGLPTVHINPELIFIAFLPPLLYEAAWASSWKELWKWRRIIGSFAFIVVFLTAAAVAIVANAIIPGFSLALGFLLGGIVSPPDAVSAAAILKFVKVPRRFSTILEGESLFNDASSLIIFRFAAVAVTTGQFVWYNAAGQFVWMLVGGVGIGILLGYIFRLVHRYLPTDANMDMIFTVIAPYLMYIAAEEVHASGVLAVVSGGLYIGAHRHQLFDAASRVRGVNVWSGFIFVLNGIVFVLIGLDLPEIMEGMRADNVSIVEATGYGVLITLVLVVVRIFSAYGAVLVTQVMKRFIAVADTRMPNLRSPLVLGWSGMRGVVSLAAALSIPMMANGAPFPQRSLVLYLTFIVIFLTLVVQGLTLPALIQRAGLTDPGDHLPEHEAMALIRKRLAEVALDEVHSQFTEEEMQKNIHLVTASQEWDFSLKASHAELAHCKRCVFEGILRRQREALIELNKRKDIDEEVLRTFYYRLDLEEEKWNH